MKRITRLLVLLSIGTTLIVFLYVQDAQSAPTSNLLVNSGFEDGNPKDFLYWTFSPSNSSCSRAQHENAWPFAHTGVRFLGTGRTSTYPNCFSVWQEVNIAPQVGQTYTAGFWLRNGSNHTPSQSQNLVIALWGIGPNSEAASKTVRVTDFEWSCHQLWFTPTQSGNNRLKVEIYLDQTWNMDIHVDDVYLGYGQVDYCSLTPPPPIKPTPPPVPPPSTLDSGTYCYNQQNPDGYVQQSCEEINNAGVSIFYTYYQHNPDGYEQSSRIVRSSTGITKLYEYQQHNPDGYEQREYSLYHDSGGPSLYTYYQKNPDGYIQKSREEINHTGVTTLYTYYQLNPDGYWQESRIERNTSNAVILYTYEQHNPDGYIQKETQWYDEQGSHSCYFQQSPDGTIINSCDTKGDTYCYTQQNSDGYVQQSCEKKNSNGSTILYEYFQRNPDGYIQRSREEKDDAGITTLYTYHQNNPDGYIQTARTERNSASIVTLYTYYQSNPDGYIQESRTERDALGNLILYTYYQRNPDGYEQWERIEGDGSTPAIVASNNFTEQFYLPSFYEMKGLDLWVTEEQGIDGYVAFDTQWHDANGIPYICSYEFPTNISNNAICGRLPGTLLYLPNITR